VLPERLLTGEKDKAGETDGGREEERMKAKKEVKPRRCSGGCAGRYERTCLADRSSKKKTKGVIPGNERASPERGTH